MTQKEAIATARKAGLSVSKKKVNDEGINYITIGDHTIYHATGSFWVLDKKNLECDLDGSYREAYTIVQCIEIILDTLKPTEPEPTPEPKEEKKEHKPRKKKTAKKSEPVEKKEKPTTKKKEKKEKPPFANTANGEKLVQFFFDHSDVAPDSWEDLAVDPHTWKVYEEILDSGLFPNSGYLSGVLGTLVNKGIVEVERRTKKQGGDIFRLTDEYVEFRAEQERAGK